MNYLFRSIDAGVILKISHVFIFCEYNKNQNIKEELILIYNIS